MPGLLAPVAIPCISRQGTETQFPVLFLAGRFSYIYKMILQDQQQQQSGGSNASFKQELVDGYQSIVDKLIDWANTFFSMLPNLVAAILIFGFFWLLGRVLQRASRRTFGNLIKNEAVNSLLSMAIFYFMLFEGLFLALNALQLEQTVTQLLAGAGIIGLALSFAFQSIATNIISGVIIAVQKPIRIGDLIRVNDLQGVVKNIGLRVVELQTFQGENVLIPSKDIIENPVINFDLTPRRRVKLEVGVSYGEDLERVQRITTEAVYKIPSLEKNSELVFSYSGFGDSSINFDLYFWIPANAQSSYLQARNEAVIAIKKAYDANDIMIPFPIRTLDFGIKGGKQLDEVKMQLNGGS